MEHQNTRALHLQMLLKIIFYVKHKKTFMNNSSIVFLTIFQESIVCVTKDIVQHNKMLLAILKFL